MTLHTAPH